MADDRDLAREAMEAAESFGEWAAQLVEFQKDPFRFIDARTVGPRVAACEQGKVAATPADALDRLRAVVTPNQAAILAFLWDRRAVGYGALAEVPGAWQGGPSDEAIQKALGRLGNKLAEHPEFGVTVSYSSAKRLAMLERPPD